MVEIMKISENKPYPNNSLPVLYYENALNDVLGDDYSSKDVVEFFENNGYEKGWIGVVKDKHHFHSNAHETLAVTKGEVTLQLGGPHADMKTFRRGDVILLPAGTAHKRLGGSENFEVVGAYPENGENLDMQYGDASNYEAIKENIGQVELPLTDPVTGSPRDIDEYWR